MVRWICGTSEKKKKISAELRDRMGIEAISNVLKRNRLRWFGPVLFQLTETEMSVN